MDNKDMIEKAIAIFNEVCYDLIDIKYSMKSSGVFFYIRKLNKRLSIFLSNEELYLSKNLTKYDNFYVIGNNIRRLLSIPKKHNIETLSSNKNYVEI